jgi:diketogulonate reductase-like aldo/keto reductase
MNTPIMRTITLPSGQSIPALGQGTWNMAENARHRTSEIAALRQGLELGMTLIDTAEMYANGAAESLVSEAIAGHRDEVFLVSKVLPNHASHQGTITACENSLRRLKIDRIDLYLLHWRGRVPLKETLDAFHTLQQTGKIRYWGVSNFDISDMQELVNLLDGSAVATNQVLYNLTRRGIEYNLLPWSAQHHLPIMAYSPIEQGRMLNHTALHTIAERHQATPAQVALAWLLRQEFVCAIPKASTPDHVRENYAALDLHLTDEDLSALDHSFPPPTRARPLEML